MQAASASSCLLVCKINTAIRRTSLSLLHCMCVGRVNRRKELQLARKLRVG